MSRIAKDMIGLRRFCKAGSSVLTQHPLREPENRIAPGGGGYSSRDLWNRTNACYQCVSSDAALSAAQTDKLAAYDQPLCVFRFDDRAMLATLTVPASDALRARVSSVNEAGA